MLRSVVRTIPTIWNTFSYLFRFAETTLAKSWQRKLISNILNNKNGELFYFFAIAISFKIKKYQHNLDKTSYNLFQCFRNLLSKLYYKTKQPAPSLPFTKRFFKNSCLAMFEEFPRNCSIKCDAVI